jgi:hypothetical protein
MLERIRNSAASVVSYLQNLDWSENAINRRLDYAFCGLAFAGTLTLGGIAYEISKQHPGFFYSVPTASKTVAREDARSVVKSNLALSVEDEGKNE